MLQRLIAASLMLSLCALPAIAQTDSPVPAETPQPEAGERVEIEEIRIIKESKDIECHCEQEHAEHKGHHGDEDTDFTKAFREGTPHLFSPNVVNADDFVLFYSHNFAFVTLPRGSNPAFWFKYSPLDKLQIDAMATLRDPREFELGLAYQILDENRGDWLSLTPRLAFNTRGTLFGGELAASKYIFPEVWQLGADLRLLSTGNPDGFNRPVAALGFNTMVRVWKQWHLFADVAIPFDSEILSTRSVLWSAGLKKRIPHTPHILTLYAGNSQEQSLAGRTISASSDLANVIKLGFIFSIEIDSVSKLPERLF